MPAGENGYGTLQNSLKYHKDLIGAGSVVTKDIPFSTAALGTPCRVLREINDAQRELSANNAHITLAFTTALCAIWRKSPA